MKTFVRNHTPKALWRALASSKYLFMDTVDSLFGRRNDLVPPRRLVFIGSGDFLITGNEFLDHFQRIGGLKPYHRVLDVGCGIGRMAIPLTTYLSKSGSYEGLDIVPHGIKWCKEKISPRFPNFQFHLADIRNKEYNPDGLVTAAEFRFPYDEGVFDFIFLTSVFTHMLSHEVGNYLAEIHRVLKPEGKCLITWFLLNEESERLIANGRSSLNFRYPVDGCLTTNLTVPEEAIAYDQARVLDFYAQSGLALDQPIRYGSWCGRNQYLSYQDICVAHHKDMPAGLIE